MEWLYLVIAIVAEVIATTALKASEAFTRPIPTLIVAVGYGLAFYLLALTLNKLPLGVVYAIWSAAGVVLVTVIAAVRFNERLDAPALLGIALIASGVLIINLFSKSVAH